jgi:hypothetical protein
MTLDVDYITVFGVYLNPGNNAVVIGGQSPNRAGAVTAIRNK